MKKAKLLLALIAFCGCAYSQDITYQKTKVEVVKLNTVHPSEIQEDWAPLLTNVEMPHPGSARYELKQIKKKSAKMFPRKVMADKSWKVTSVNDPTIGMNFPVATKVVIAPGDTLTIYLAGGRPNDNTLGISNEGTVLTSFNSRIYTYNTNLDTVHMAPISLHSFSTEFTNNGKFDPKILYDPISDRFILVFLNGYSSTESQLIVCFSSTNNPADPWNLYAFSGNPLNDTTWTDYPAIALSEGELFLTINLLRDGEPWQTGFAQTIIWQIDKQNGYDGDTVLNTMLWQDIKYNGQNIRNLNPIQGGSGPIGDNIYLLSNKNFTILSDTIFLVEVTGDQYDTGTQLNVTLGHSNLPYGAPPSGRQSIDDSLATNDARILGGFIENGEIQYVSCSIDTASGFAALYHGFINDLDNAPIFTANMLRDDSLDLGYPNIAYTGNHICSRQAIIILDHTSPSRNPGISTLLYGSDNSYSNLISLKEAEGPIDRGLPPGDERWGDYSGIQRRYNDTGTVWTAGFYGRADEINYTWVSEVTAEAETELSADITNTSNSSVYSANDGSATVQISGGYAPYSIVWTDANSQTTNTAQGLAPGQYVVNITDAANCTSNDSTTITEPLPGSTVFLNPAVDMATVYFQLEAAGEVSIAVYDAKGSRIKTLYEGLAKQGANIFSFSTVPLLQGVYILKILSGKKEIVSEKIIKL